MKTRYIKKVWMAALPLALMTAACQNEELIEGVQTPATEGTTVLRAVMGSYDNPQSRAQVELGNADENQEIFMWNSEDSFTLYDKSAGYASSVFTISGYNEENPSAEATFIGEGELAQGAEVLAFYPAQGADAVSDNVLTLTMPKIVMTDGSDEDWKNYMRQSMFMHAGTTMNGVNTSLAFNHFCAMARVSYTNATEDDLAISTVALNSGADCFGNTLIYDLQNQTAQVSNSLPSVSLEFSGLTVPSGRTVDFYLLFFPNSNTETNVSVSIGENESAPVTLSAGFEAGKRYWFNVMQTKTEGLIWKKDIEEGVIANLPLISIVEEKAELQFDRDENGFVNVADNQAKIDQVTGLYLSDKVGQIDNLDGLEYFTKIERLELTNLGIQKLDVSSMENLKYLDCIRNDISSLDVSKNTQLTELHCSENPLGEIDLSTNSELVVLDCFDNLLSELDVTKNTKLEELYCGLNKIADLDVSQNERLKELSLTFGAFSGYGNSEIPANLITSINLQNNPDLISLEVDNCHFLKDLDVSYNEKLETLRCGNTAISSLDLSENIKLKYLDCSNLKIQSIDVSNNTNLEELEISWTEISSLDVSNNLSLKGLYCYGNRLTELDITANTALLFRGEYGKIFRCGNQQDANYTSIPLTLYLTSEQLSLWEQVKDEWGNENVTPVVKE